MVPTSREFHRAGRIDMISISQFRSWTINILRLFPILNSKLKTQNSKLCLNGVFVQTLTKHQVKVKFVLVGMWNTIFGYGIFCLFDTLFAWLLSSRSAAYMSAMVLAHPLAVINAYICHKYITFKSEAKGKAIIAEFFRFSTTYVVTFCLSLVLLPALVEIGHIRPKIAAAIIILLCTVISYLGHSRFSFRR